MKYPNGIIKEYKHHNNYGNRGMSLENELNDTNKYYLDNNIAVIHKKPTPITISKVDYSNKLDAVIKEGHFRTPSTTDYNGIYKGKYIDFEAKETRNQYFPLSNIHEHQIDHLKRIMNCGGIGFVIVRFTSLNETYYLSIEQLICFIEGNIRKSIPIEYFKEKGFLIKQGYNPYLDYLKIVEEFI